MVLQIIFWKDNYDLDQRTVTLTETRFLCEELIEVIAHTKEGQIKVFVRRIDAINRTSKMRGRLIQHSTSISFFEIDFCVCSLHSNGERQFVDKSK
jgi:hypothetical protein